MIAKIIQFIERDIWRIRVKNLPAAKALLIEHLRILLAAWKGFDNHQCQLRASALTFFSLLSIVPVAAMAFGIAKGFDMQTVLQERLLEKFEGQEEVLTKVFDFANALLANTNGGVIAGVGVAVLFWTIIKVLGNIESSLNDIWGIKKPRSISRKATDYLSVMLISPILLVVSGSATIFIASQVTFITQKIAVLGALGTIVSFILKFAPYSIMWALFTFIYIFMPNTKVNFKSGIFGGIIAGTIYQAVQWLYVTFQVGVAQYNAIYGSFAALPLFLAWVQLSWLIVLAGAELSYVHQYSDMLEFEPDIERVSISFRKLLTLRVVSLLAKNFSQGLKPLTMSDISHATDIPKKLIKQILNNLTECGIVIETSNKQGHETVYQPALDTDHLTINYVLDVMERCGISDIPVEATPELNILTESLQTFKNELEKSPANRILRDI
ncbi:MAG TPA: YhjD/YihY/BrkB family envelope integrity protein [Syntrophales bacterium]|nr:YhjD/YihY/BrkB family envelope integrity protein [Syntrophales bacterium]